MRLTDSDRTLKACSTLLPRENTTIRCEHKLKEQKENENARYAQVI